MKTLKELGISPAPWVQGKICKDMIKTEDLYRIIATADTSGLGYINDARLISAAPELYEALYIAFNSLNDMQDEHRKLHTDGGETCDGCVNIVKWLKMAKEALEKAGGAE